MKIIIIIFIFYVIYKIIECFNNSASSLEKQTDKPTSKKDSNIYLDKTKKDKVNIKSNSEPKYKSINTNIYKNQFNYQQNNSNNSDEHLESLEFKTDDKTHLYHGTVFLCNNEKEIEKKLKNNIKNNADAIFYIEAVNCSNQYNSFLELYNLNKVYINNDDKNKVVFLIILMNLINKSLYEDAITPGVTAIDEILLEFLNGKIESKAFEEFCHIMQESLGLSDCFYNVLLHYINSIIIITPKDEKNTNVYDNQFSPKPNKFINSDEHLKLLGFNLYSDKEDAKKILENNIRTNMEEIFYNEAINSSNQYDLFLESYNLNRTCLNDNSRSVAIFLIIILNLMVKELNNDEDTDEDTIVVTTINRMLLEYSGRKIGFKALVEFTYLMQESIGLSDNFYNALLDYIVSVIRK